MFRNILSSNSVEASNGGSDKIDKTHGMHVKSSSGSQKPKEQCPHCNHSFLNSLKSHLRLNKSCGTRQLNDSTPIKKQQATSSANQIKSKAMLLLAKQSKQEKLDNSRLANGSAPAVPSESGL